MGHWYDKEGNPRYTVPYADPRKGERDATLSDAKKLGLVPSVTTITSVVGSDALVNYKMQQLLDAVLKYPYENGVDVNKWRSAMVQASKEHSEKAAKRGNEIHNALEDYFKTGKISRKEKAYIEPVIESIHKEYPDFTWIAEASFTSQTHGYGGKVDLHGYYDEGDYILNPVIIDFKTKGTDDRSKMKAYNGHHMQLASYALGLFEDWGDQVDRRNIFISTETPGVFEWTQSPNENYNKDVTMFLSLLEFWKLDNNYNPVELWQKQKEK